MAHAAQLYAADADGYYAHNMDVWEGYWWKQLQPYHRMASPARCPEYTPHEQVHVVAKSFATGYAITLCLIMDGNYRTVGSDRSVPNPSRMVLFADAADVRGVKHPTAFGNIVSLQLPDKLQFRDTGVPTDPTFEIAGKAGAERHGGGGNYVMLDGHAKRLLVDQMRYPIVANPCGLDTQGKWGGNPSGPSFAPLP